ncbi:AraC family transcriptional regulator of arabinose operon [Mesocricetibacter intestinalis]|uniref:AraC family transcriptional regulator of arabinose operon n=1 Tax=Mesocricetibacter intestinalis TaxID=1521930 RepID=A0A4R6V737_9PAST|nr:arabinose operon transcriptional regulator AraC [Mesocricetibacter intestinalis]TDQ56803.1 AraC family transcriptional regulator of arabinose operon [Mesocricetibacter intestinalis]
MLPNNLNLSPIHAFRAEVVAGITQCEKGNDLDFTVDRAEGMEGYMLQLTTFGKGFMFDGSDRLPLQRGQLLLFSPKAAHHYYRQPEYQFWHYKWVYFSPPSRWLKWLNWSNTVRGIGRIQLGDNQYFQEISQLFTKLETELKSSHPLKQTMAASLLEYLLMKCVSVEQIEIAPPLDSRIVKVCDLILANPAAKHNVQYFADKVYLSESRLSHLFKQALGVGLVQWRDMQRIAEAKKLLYFSDMSVNKIAKSLGYEDALYFSKVFKKYQGVSPARFRNTQQRENG